MKILLHIGRQKTGTTSIQRYLLENGPVLEEAGYYYSHEATHKQEGHHAYADLLLSPGADPHDGGKAASGKPSAFSELFDYLRPDKINIISSEAFQNCDPEAVKNAFEGHDVTVACYIRSELDAIVSSYVQKVHASKYASSMEQYAQETKIDYLDFLTRWSSAFGEKFHVRVFDKEYLDEGNAIYDFFRHFLHIEPPADALTFKDGNPSLTNRMLAFKLEANSRGKRIARVYRRLSILSKLDKDSGKVRMAEELKAKLIGQYGKNQKKWATRFFSKDAIFDYSAVKTGENYDMSEEEFMEYMSLLSEWSGAGAVPSSGSKSPKPPPSMTLKQRIYIAYRVLKGR